MAAARILCRKTASLTLHGSVALRMYSLSSIDHRTYRNHVLIQTAARVAHRHGERAREYTDEAKVSGRSTSRWRLYKYLILFGVPGGLVFYLYYQMKLKMEEVKSTIDGYYPSTLIGKVSQGVDAVSAWIKAQKETVSAVNSSPGQSTTTARQDRLLQSEVKELQGKVASLEKENYELKQQLSKYIGLDMNIVRRARQKSLIELYTDVLNLLADFQAKSSKKEAFVNTLPQVVVVGDQSSGKTSVLEMVANARIFPRGGGEMMTRSPVMVTLCEGPEHIAVFKDSSLVYKLTVEEDLKKLRREIKARMKASVKNGNTISEVPISLTVYGPQLKRMVLVDLPGIISTVTAGMATSTREDIIRISRRYMQNPNAIIMCIQDGAVDAERSIVTDLVSQMDPSGQRTVFVLTKVDLAEKSGFKQERILSILDGRLFPMKALGYYAVVTGRGVPAESIEEIQQYEREYFAKSKLFQNGLLRESQLSTRNMVNAVTEEFWKMVQGSINEQALHFKTLRYNLETEWRNNYPGERTLDRDDLFELGKVDILNQVASLQVVQPAKWESLLMEQLWNKMAEKVIDIFIEASQEKSSGEFNTSVDIKMHKWADSLQFAELCAQVGRDTLFDQLHKKVESIDGGKFHILSHGLREEVERLSKLEHKWDLYNIDQLKYVQMSALDDKDVPSAEQWQSACNFMSASLKKYIKQAEDDLNALRGPTAFYDRWIKWKSQSHIEAERSALVEEFRKILLLEPNHGSKLFMDEIISIQRSLKSKGYSTAEEELKYTWNYVYKLHFMKRAEETAVKCQKGYLLRQHSHEYACPQVEFFWRVQQVMKSSAHTLRVQIMDREVRKVEQQVKVMLDTIALNEARKKELIRGDAVDKAEQLKHVRLIQEKLDAFKEALSKQQKRTMA